jgi:hypothetical protein
VRWENLYVAGTGSALPSRIETAQDAVAAGRYTDRARAVSGYRAVRVAAEDEPGPVLAARAGRQALERSGLRPEDVGLVLHAYSGHQGRDVWSPASYVEHEVLGGGGAPAYEVRQGCNGGLSALELAASHLTARPGSKAALITSGDAFHLPYLDRWNTDEQMVYGDGGGAAVLSTGGGIARILATASVSDSSLEIMDRGLGPWTRAPFEGGPAGRPAGPQTGLLRGRRERLRVRGGPRATAEGFLGGRRRGAVGRRPRSGLGPVVCAHHVPRADRPVRRPRPARVHARGHSVRLAPGARAARRRGPARRSAPPGGDGRTGAGRSAARVRRGRGTRLDGGGPRVHPGTAPLSATPPAHELKSPPQKGTSQ